MAYNGSGTFVRLYDWTTDKTNLVPVTASRMDDEMDGFATGLSSAIARDGQSTTTGRIPFAAGTSAFQGSTSGVSYGHTNDANTGLYFPGSDEWGLVAGGTATITSTATKVTMPVAVDFTGAAAPTSNDGAALGSTSQKWSDLWLASGGVIDFNSGDVTITHSSNALAFAGGSYSFAGAVTISSGGAAITGNSTITGTFGVSSDFAINTDKFTVAGASGNTVVAGTLGVTGNVAVNTDKFTVTASNGNTLVAGTLAVTGASTLTGALSANNAAGVTGRNTAKAYVTFDGADATIRDSFGVSGVVRDSVGDYTVTFSTAMESEHYTHSLSYAHATLFYFLKAITKTTTTITIKSNLSSGGDADPTTISLTVFDNS